MNNFMGDGNLDGVQSVTITVGRVEGEKFVVTPHRPIRTRLAALNELLDSSQKDLESSTVDPTQQTQS